MEPFETREDIIETEDIIGTIDEPLTVVKKKKKMPTWAIVLIVIFCSLALCIGLLFAASAALNSVSGCLGDMTHTDTHFDDMVYTRPDEDAIIGKLDGIIKSIEENKLSFDEQLNSLMQFDSDYYDIHTMYSLATIKHSQDITNEFYTEEVDFFSEFIPLYSQKVEEIFVACAQSPHISKFEANYFGKGTLENYADGSTITDKTVRLNQYVLDITNEYIREVSNPTIPYNGVETSLSELLSNSDMTYNDYSEIIHTYYEKYNPLFGEMYISIVKSNMQIADELGYDSYIDYAYESYGRDYTPEDAAQYMEDIKTYMVPLFKKLTESGAYDITYSSFEYNEESVLNILGFVTEEMGNEFSSIYDYMVRNELYDLSASENKELNSYTTYLYNYEAPYIFISPTGTDSDLMTTIHEFGHFAEKYMNYGYSSGLDCDETASQGMEFLSLSYLHSSLSEQQMYQVKIKKLLEALDTFIYQGYYNEFETRVYSLDIEDVTLENLNKIAKESAEEFGLTYYEPWVDYYTYCWVDIPHIYQSPFYVVSYCTSADVALQIYALAQGDVSDAAFTYSYLINWDWDMTFIENVEDAGLESPFAEGRVEKSAAIIENYFYS